jgi:dolichol-phosphate mannosyltransferase
MQDLELSIILPTYNEGENILPMIYTLQKVLAGVRKEIMVIDDNSPDKTSEIVQREFVHDNEVKVVIRYANRGLANSIREGIEKSCGNIIVVMDTDFNHNPLDVPALFNIARYVDIVIGSRYVYGGSMKDRTRYYLSYLYNRFLRIMVGTKIYDNLCGFFSIRREKMFSLDFDKIFWGYGDYFLRMLLIAQKNNFKIIEFPIVYEDRQGGSSKSSQGFYIPILLKYTREMIKLMIMKYSNKL